MNWSEEHLNSKIDSRGKLELPLPTQDVDERINSETRHQCTVCNKSFATVSNLNNHHREIHERVHQCTVCNKSYSTAGQLNRHHREVHQRVRYACSLCSKTFPRANEVKRHVQEIHEGRRTEFECNECKKVFYKKRSLKIHQEIHSGTRFHCEFCDRTYSHSTNLRAHIWRKHRQDQEVRTGVDNTLDMHTGMPDASTEYEGMNRIHSFTMKIEDESDEEGEDEVGM